MQMQEPQQQQWKTDQEYGAYDGEEAWRQRSGQAQKVHPQEEPVMSSTVLAILAIVFSAIGFFGTVAGVIASSLVLQYANGNQTSVLVGGGIGLGCSILAMLMFIGIYIVAVITLAGRRGRRRYRSNRFPSA